MNAFRTIAPQELEENLFSMIGEEGMLITAKKEGKVNTMTASWGGAGFLWNRPVAFIFIRPQRFTKEFIDAGCRLSLSFLGSAYRQQLNYLGTVSGRDEPKIEKSGLTLRYEEAAPFFDEARTAFLCRKLFAQELRSESFLDRKLIDRWYPKKDFHTLYACEIERVLIR